MGIYIIQILPAAKIRKYSYNFTELSLAEIILMCAAPGMLINAGVTRKEKQKNQQRGVVIYLPIHTALKDNPSNPLVSLKCPLYSDTVFPGHGYQVIYQANYMRHTQNLLFCVFITPNRNRYWQTHTQAHTHTEDL